MRFNGAGLATFHKWKISCPGPLIATVPMRLEIGALEIGALEIGALEIGALEIVLEHDSHQTKTIVARESMLTVRSEN